MPQGLIFGFTRALGHGRLLLSLPCDQGPSYKKHRARRAVGAIYAALAAIARGYQARYAPPRKKERGVSGFR